MKHAYARFITRFKNANLKPHLRTETLGYYKSTFIFFLIDMGIESLL